MAGGTSRPRAASRSRTAKSRRTTTSERTAKSASATKSAGTATSGRWRRWGWTRRPATSDRTPEPERGSRAERRPLPLLLRLLAMLFAFAFMVAFAVVLARLTLRPSPASEALTHTNLHPGRSLRAYLDQPELRDAVRQIGGNLLLGVPFGVLVPVLAPRARGVLRVLLLTATVMLLVEFAQGAMVTGRAFDVDDVILNTSGALIGYLLLGRRLSRAVHARERRLWARPVSAAPAGRWPRFRRPR